MGLGGKVLCGVGVGVGCGLGGGVGPFTGTVFNRPTVVPSQSKCVVLEKKGSGKTGKGESGGIKKGKGRSGVGGVGRRPRSSRLHRKLI